MDEDEDDGVDGFDPQYFAMDSIPKMFAMEWIQDIHTKESRGVVIPFTILPELPMNL